MRKKGKKTYSEDYVAVMLEDMHDQFGAFGDGLKLLNEKIDGLKTRLDNLEAGLDGLKNRMGSLENKMGSLENRMDSLENRMGRLEIKVDNIAGDIADIKEKLSRKVDWDDFHKLEKRVFKLEKVVLSKL